MSPPNQRMRPSASRAATPDFDTAVACKVSQTILTRPSPSLRLPKTLVLSFGDSARRRRCICCGASAVPFACRLVSYTLALGASGGPQRPTDEPPLCGKGNTTSSAPPSLNKSLDRTQDTLLDQAPREANRDAGQAAEEAAEEVEGSRRAA